MYIHVCTTETTIKHYNQTFVNRVMNLLCLSGQIVLEHHR